MILKFMRINPVGIVDPDVAVVDVSGQMNIVHTVGNNPVRRILARRNRRHSRCRSRSSRRHQKGWLAKRCRSSSCPARWCAPVGIVDMVVAVVDDVTRRDDKTHADGAVRARRFKTTKNEIARRNGCRRSRRYCRRSHRTGWHKKQYRSNSWSAILTTNILNEFGAYFHQIP